MIPSLLSQLDIILVLLAVWLKNEPFEYNL